ncbi:hypothetical protein BB934_44210 (plasmid) [Microvirga ossetica]|uniref:Uncharacterized protein n=1 Tax=Microvirga ossetica TaxID=1882682 RepID=A0A1B2EZ16_9HYPH|nr:hypothetical protein BB934_44210 [Microvirga ossetica]
MLAAELGLPYFSARHFAPDSFLFALQVYRSRFEPPIRTTDPMPWPASTSSLRTRKLRHSGWQPRSRCPFADLFHGDWG